MRTYKNDAPGTHRTGSTTITTSQKLSLSILGAAGVQWIIVKKN